MSWFNKIRNDSRASSDTASDRSFERRTRRDTDPGTCFEVFQNHWDQAYRIIKRDVEQNTKSTDDEMKTVSHNFEQMVTLLADEDGEEGQGMPGPILHYLLEHEILEKFCGWCHRYRKYRESTASEELRMFETLISQSHQLLLIHKPVIRPLLNLLAYCSDESTDSPEIESNLVLVLHQLCVSISKEAVILESFFNMNADHGPTKFLIFSLLIPYIHKHGKVGQQARDALLLIMTLSAKHPYIGHYIADNSDFCPVLATGLSGLYSALPRKIAIPNDDWCQISDDDVYHIPEMAMFMNSLEFCNAVAQIAHPLVRDQLIKFIYNGFLLPVLGPALHQEAKREDISGLPTPLLDSPMFSNSREEVITATAYLDLFLRKISEPCLVKAFLMFIFKEKNDEIVILDSLITRINSSSKLSLVSLSLFHTLVDLNCEDVMFDLVFKYLIPCTHVMVSQRRAVKDQDIYCKSAEKFLSLRPTCCLPEIESPKHGAGVVPTVTSNNSLRSRTRKLFQTKKNRALTQSMNSEPNADEITTAFPPGSYGSKLEDFETNYLEYLTDANVRLQKCAQACSVWQYPYDGNQPPANCFDLDSETGNQSNVGANSFTDFMSLSTLDGNCNDVKGDIVYIPNTDADVYKGRLNDDIVDCQKTSKGNNCDISNFSLVDSAIVKPDILEDDISGFYGSASKRGRYASEEEFITMLEETDTPTDVSADVEESLQNLESVLSNVSQAMISCTSTPKHDRNLDSLAVENDISTVYFDCESSQGEESLVFKSIEETTYEVIDDPTRNKTKNATEFEVLDSHVEEESARNGNKQPVNKTGNITSYVDISSNVLETAKDSDIPEFRDRLNTEAESLAICVNHFAEVSKLSQPLSGILVTKATEDEKGEGQQGGKGDKSVRFAESTQVLPAKSLFAVGMSSSFKKSGTPNIGPFLVALLLKLEGMMQNSLPVNLMLTGLVSRLAVYSQPLLRSFLLNHNLVFQPTVKSLVQVLTGVRQRVDHFSYSIQNFETLLLRARRTLAQREGKLPQREHSMSPSPEMNTKLRAATISDVPSKEKRHRTLTEMLFRRNSKDKKTEQNMSTKGTKIEILSGNKGIRYMNKRPEDRPFNPAESSKTRNAVYCAIVLEEFVKELAALTQEHSILLVDGEDL
ncbi:FHF complex subunit HOOK interacting protein 1B-like isoform X3 [Dreissena polymorpha]|uniref:FHF complex subunit HOOK interacting protein 1B-like isoform X3 n=1 Tax=Dreissena polymorpha TaxID=45954 RepID=UPI002264DDD7|nr:FHF complex subunit HOOK interacting protein 1B-like isoform X3 [Dreissena polymorpha]